MFYRNVRGVAAETPRGPRFFADDSVIYDRMRRRAERRKGWSV
jgi:hypothetical protein